MATDTPMDLWSYRDSFHIASGDLDFSGFEVVGRDGSIGTVDKATNRVSASYLIVDTGEWHPGHQVLLPAATVESIDGDRKLVFVDRSREEIEKAPDLTKRDMRTAAFQDRLQGYYHGLYDTGL